jgi:hypothetical protein
MGRKAAGLKDFGLEIADSGITTFIPKSEIQIPKSQGGWVAELGLTSI